MKHTYSITIDLRLVEALYTGMTQAGLPQDASFSQLTHEAIKYFVADQDIRILQNSNEAIERLPRHLVPASLRGETSESFNSIIKQSLVRKAIVEDLEA